MGNKQQISFTTQTQVYSTDPGLKLPCVAHPILHYWSQPKTAQSNWSSDLVSETISSPTHPCSRNQM